MPQPLDVVVDRAVLLDIGVGLRDVRLGLVIVVVGDEVLDGVVRQHLPQLVGQLRGQCLVGGHHEGRPLQPLDQPGGGGRLAGAGGAEQHHVALPGADPPFEFVDGRGLVARRLMITDHLEAGAGAHRVLDSAVFGVSDDRLLGRKSHASHPKGARRHPPPATAAYPESGL